MKATQNHNDNWKTITVSKNKEILFDKECSNKLHSLAIDKQSGHIIRTSTIAEIKDGRGLKTTLAANKRS